MILWRVQIWAPNDPDPWTIVETLHDPTERLEEFCANGDIESIKRICAEWRGRRPDLAIVYFERSLCFRNAFGGVVSDTGRGEQRLFARNRRWRAQESAETWGENARWDVIKCLIEEGFSLNAPAFGGSHWNLPNAIAKRACMKGRGTEELQRLLDMGWDINSCVKGSRSSSPTMA
jgi:hypothetical protein